MSRVNRCVNNIYVCGENCEHISSLGIKQNIASVFKRYSFDFLKFQLNKYAKSSNNNKQNSNIDTPLDLAFRWHRY